MPVDVIVGGQGGDEGKGKMAAYLALKQDYDICMRVPSPQAGHSIVYNGQKIVLALLPCGIVNPRSRILIGPGGLISLERLLDGFVKKRGDGSEKFIPPEIPTTGITPERLGIDYRATFVTPEHKKAELEDDYLMKVIKSVGEGISACRIEKLLRKKSLKFAKDEERLKDYLTDTVEEVQAALESGKTVLLEGDHGAKLDLVHGEYPHVTSRIVNASGFLAEAGIGPRARDVYVVMKPYTTRSGTGPLQRITHPDVAEWAIKYGGETGSVSGNIRGIGEFDWDAVGRVIKMNSASKLVFTHMDCFGAIGKHLGYETDRKFLEDVEKRLCSKYPHPKISLLSYGPEEKDVVEVK